MVGIDTWFDAETGKYHVNQYTGDETTRVTQWETLDWVEEVQKRGAGEIVLNMMNQDGVRNGYDLQQLAKVRAVCHVPLIASGGAGTWNTSSKPSATPTLTARWRPRYSTNRLLILAN
jgi:cyclase